MLQIFNNIYLHTKRDIRLREKLYYVFLREIFLIYFFLILTCKKSNFENNIIYYCI